MFKFWKRQTPEPTKVLQIIRSSTFAVTMSDGSTHSWTVEPYTRTGKLDAWKDFYRWYYGRTGATFIQRYKDGEMMIRRKDIRRFSVNISSRTVDA